MVAWEWEPKIYGEQINDLPYPKAKLSSQSEISILVQYFLLLSRASFER
jgi:hypothetical protein